MSEFRLRFATDELERANREAENCRLVWKIARTASPTQMPLDEMEAYCEAADYAATALTNWERAQAEEQAEWAARRNGEAEQRAARSPLPFGGSLAVRAPSPDGGLAHRETGRSSVRVADIHTFARED